MACKKEDMSHPALASGPQLIQGRLAFRSIAELQSYCGKIHHDIHEQGLDIQSYLDSVERELRFTSARTAENLTRSGNKSLEADDDSLTEYLTEAEIIGTDWLKDDIRKSLLNEYSEIQVGDSVYVYISENTIYRASVNHAEAINSLRIFQKGDDDQIAKSTLAMDGVDLISQKYEVMNFRKRGNFVNCYYDEYLYYSFEECNPNIAHFHLEGSIDADWNGSDFHSSISYIEVHLDYGDGTTQTISGTNPEWTHEYPGEGEYQLQATVTYSDLCNQGQEITINLEPENDDIIYISDVSCCGLNRSIDEFVGAGGLGSIGMRSELWFKRDIFGSHQVAKTTSYRRVNSLLGGIRWARRSAYVKAEINWKFRTNECEVTTLNNEYMFTGLETDCCNSCRSKRAAKTGITDRKIGNNEVHSLHKVERNGQILTKTHRLKFCP